MLDIRKTVRKFLFERHTYDVVDIDDFKSALLDLATLDMEESQVGYPNLNGKKFKYLFGVNNFSLYLINRDELPLSGPFEITIDNPLDETIGFIRGTKSDNIISFNFIHILEEYRGMGIGTSIYEEFLNLGYIIKSDSEISDYTYAIYDKLVRFYGYEPLIFGDDTVGMRKF
jgi:ribosomal protein S18 acetylase RimI-like enzyme